MKPQHIKPLNNRLDNDIYRVLPELKEIYKALHENPELLKAKKDNNIIADSPKFLPVLHPAFKTSLKAMTTAVAVWLEKP